MHRLITQNPASFPADESLSPLIGEHTGEDWYRAYSLIRFHHRTVTLASKPKASTAKRGPKNVEAEKPKFLKDADFQAFAPSGPGDEGELSDDPESSSSDDEDYVLDEDPPALGAEVEDRVESSIEATANILSQRGNLN
jgi:hypothetical protein